MRYMRLEASFQGSLQKVIKRERKIAGKAVTTAIRRSTSGLQNELRRQVKKAGLGYKLQKAWQKIVFPERGFSMDAAGFVYSKATNVHSAFMQSGVITPRRGRYLVIPLPPAIESGLHLKHGRGWAASNPRKMSQVLGKFDFVPYKKDKGLLVKKVGKKTIPYFLLVKQTRMRKRLEFDQPVEKWGDKIPNYIVKAMEKYDRSVK